MTVRFVQANRNNQLYSSSLRLGAVHLIAAQVLPAGGFFAKTRETGCPKRTRKLKSKGFESSFYDSFRTQNVTTGMSMRSNEKTPSILNEAKTKFSTFGFIKVIKAKLERPKASTTSSEAESKHKFKLHRPQLVKTISKKFMKVQKLRGNSENPPFAQNTVNVHGDAISIASTETVVVSDGAVNSTNKVVLDYSLTPPDPTKVSTDSNFETQPPSNASDRKLNSECLKQCVSSLNENVNQTTTLDQLHSETLPTGSGSASKDLDSKSRQSYTVGASMHSAWVNESRDGPQNLTQEERKQRQAALWEAFSREDKSSLSTSPRKMQMKNFHPATTVSDQPKLHSEYLKRSMAKLLESPSTRTAPESKTSSTEIHHTTTSSDVGESVHTNESAIKCLSDWEQNAEVLIKESSDLFLTSSDFVSEEERSLALEMLKEFRKKGELYVAKKPQKVFKFSSVELMMEQVWLTVIAQLLNWVETDRFRSILDEEAKTFLTTHLDQQRRWNMAICNLLKRSAPDTGNAVSTWSLCCERTAMDEAVMGEVLISPEHLMTIMRCLLTDLTEVVSHVAMNVLPDRAAATTLHSLYKLRHSVRTGGNDQLSKLINLYCQHIMKLVQRLEQAPFDPAELGEVLGFELKVEEEYVSESVTDGEEVISQEEKDIVERNTWLMTLETPAKKTKTGWLAEWRRKGEEFVEQSRLLNNKEFVSSTVRKEHLRAKRLRKALLKNLQDGETLMDSPPATEPSLQGKIYTSSSIDLMVAQLYWASAATLQDWAVEGGLLADLLAGQNYTLIVGILKDEVKKYVRECQRVYSLTKEIKTHQVSIKIKDFELMKKVLLTYQLDVMTRFADCEPRLETRPKETEGLDSPSGERKCLRYWMSKQIKGYDFAAANRPEGWIRAYGDYYKSQKAIGTLAFCRMLWHQIVLWLRRVGRTLG